VVKEPAALTVLGLPADIKIIRKPRASCSQDTASVLLGVDGLQVIDAEAGPDGRVPPVG